jgi:hypothetical protein
LLLVLLLLLLSPLLGAIHLLPICSRLLLAVLPSARRLLLQRPHRTIPVWLRLLAVRRGGVLAVCCRMLLLTLCAVRCLRASKGGQRRSGGVSLGC